MRYPAIKHHATAALADSGCPPGTTGETEAPDTAEALVRWGAKDAPPSKKGQS
jgi:hypothetical protein